MTWPIALYLLIGAVFGLLTYSKRHLFSEGPSKASGGTDSLGGRLMWAAICSCLWPLMALTGLYSGWRLWRARSDRDAGR